MIYMYTDYEEYVRFMNAMLKIKSEYENMIRRDDDD